MTSVCSSAFITVMSLNTQAITDKVGRQQIESIEHINYKRLRKNTTKHLSLSHIPDTIDWNVSLECKQ